MSEESQLQGLFLADPKRAETRLAYIAWLEERSDPRGEYLRFLTGLDEPVDPEASGAVRQRLRELRSQIASDWTDAVDRTQLATAGFYQADGVQDYRYYLRFYAEGTVRLDRQRRGTYNTPEAGWQRLCR